MCVSSRSDMKKLFVVTLFLRSETCCYDNFFLVYFLGRETHMPYVWTPWYPLHRWLQDMRIRTLHHGKTIDELEETLPPMREERLGLSFQLGLLVEVLQETT